MFVFCIFYYRNKTEFQTYILGILWKIASRSNCLRHISTYSLVQGNKESSDIEFYKVTIRELYRNFTNAILKPLHISPVSVVSATEITITEIWMCTLAPITTPLSFIQTVNNPIMYRKCNIKTKETKIKKKKKYKGHGGNLKADKVSQSKSEYLHVRAYLFLCFQVWHLRREKYSWSIFKSLKASKQVAKYLWYLFNCMSNYMTLGFRITLSWQVTLRCAGRLYRGIRTGWVNELRSVVWISTRQSVRVKTAQHIQQYHI